MKSWRPMGDRMCTSTTSSSVTTALRRRRRRAPARATGGEPVRTAGDRCGEIRRLALDPYGNMGGMRAGLVGTELVVRPARRIEVGQCVAAGSDGGSGSGKRRRRQARGRAVQSGRTDVPHIDVRALLVDLGALWAGVDGIGVVRGSRDGTPARWPQPGRLPTAFRRPHGRPLGGHERWRSRRLQRREIPAAGARPGSDRRPHLERRPGRQGYDLGRDGEGHLGAAQRRPDGVIRIVERRHYAGLHDRRAARRQGVVRLLDRRRLHRGRQSPAGQSAGAGGRRCPRHLRGPRRAALDRCHQRWPTARRQGR